MDLNLLTIFEAVVRTTSFSAAAKELRLPKSSVSRGIARLEADLGAQLLFRTTRKVAPSADGTALYDRVAPLLESVKAALGELPEAGEQPTGELRVTAPVDLGAIVLAEVATRYTARYPGVRLDLNLTNRVVDLVADGFDVALRVADRLGDSSLVARKAAPMVTQLFASPIYLARRGTPRSEEDLAGHDWVVFGRARAKLQLEGPRGRVELSPSGRITCDDILFVRDALRAGAGIGLLPAFIAEADVTAGTLVRILPRHERRVGHLWIVTPATRHMPRKVTAFRDLVLEVLKVRPLAAAG